MTDLRRALIVPVLLLLGGCGNNNIAGPISTPSVSPTSSATLLAPATGTPTPSSAPPATSTPAATATATIPLPPTQTAAPSMTNTPAAAVALFSADPADPNNPFPSDRLLDAGGHVQVPVGYLDPDLPPAPEFQAARDYIANIGTQLSALTGFPTFAPLRLRFDRPVVVDAGANPTGVLLLDYDDLSQPPWPISAQVYDPDNAIEVQPLLPLKPKTTYVLIGTTALTDAAGRHVQPSADFERLLAGNGLTPALAALRTQLQPVLDVLDSVYGVSGDAVAVATIFTTEPTTDDLVAIRQRLSNGELVPGAPVFQNAPIPNLTTGIFTEGTPEFTQIVGSATSPNIAAVAVGVFDSYDFRVNALGAFDPNVIYGGGTPRVNHLDFYMTIPKAPPPPGGYPIAIFGHGLGGSNKDVLGVPAELGDAPIMTIAISALQHGRRGNPINFFVLNNIAATREFFRQTVADFMQVARMVENAHAAGTAPFDMVDATHIEYFGVSLGGIMGTLFMAVEPDVKVGMLSVPGGGLPNILASHDIGGLLDPLVSLEVGIDLNDPEFAPFVHHFSQISEWALEPADPINYGRYIVTPGRQLPGVPPKRVLVHEGIVDNTIPNRTTDDLSRAMQLPDLNASHGCTDDNGCSGIWRYVMVDYGQPELSGHSVSFSVPQARMQLAEFLQSFGTDVLDVSPNAMPEVARVALTRVAVPGSVPPPNPTSNTATPPELNQALASVYQLSNTADADVDKVLVLVPGFLGGANNFDYLARRVVLRSGGKTAVWALDRRSNALEDQTGMDAAEAAHDPDVAKNYYFNGAAIGGKSFAGFLSGSAVSFESEWGIKTHVEDLDALISAALQRYPQAAIFLGGHSLGGSIVPIYAAWNFGDHAGFERLSGLVLLEGTAMPQSADKIPRQQQYETTGIVQGLGRTSLASVRSDSPIASLEPFVGTDVFATTEIIAMRNGEFGAPEAPSPDAALVTQLFSVLFGLTALPPMTNRAVLGFGFDDNFEPLSFARVSIGSPVGPVGPNPQAALFANFVAPGDMLLAPTSTQANYDWTPADQLPTPEATDLSTFARLLYAGPSNFIEWYFPNRLTLDVAVTDELNVQRTGDWRQDVYGMAVTENARVDVPVFAVAGGRGLVRDVANFNPYRDAIAPTLRNGTLRTAVPEGFEEVLRPGFVHLDVLTASDTRGGNGIFGPLVEWMDAAVPLAPPPRRS